MSLGDLLLWVLGCEGVGGGEKVNALWGEGGEGVKKISGKKWGGLGNWESAGASDWVGMGMGLPFPVTVVAEVEND